MRYRLTHENYVIRDDGAAISTFDTPEFPNENPNYLAYLEWLQAGNTPDPAPAIDTEIIRKNMLGALADEYEERMLILSAAYPQSERESWPVQTNEARLLLSNPLASTPWIDAAATQRGLTRQELAARIVAKDEAYRVIHGTITGVKQRLEDAITYATAVQLQQIDIKAGWPV